MRRYIKADLFRIYTRISRWILFILILAVVVFLDFPDGESDATTYIEMVNYALSVMALVLGVFEMGYIYGDDFRSKTMTIAIGSGIRREKIILAKWLEVMIVVGIDLILIDFAALISPVIMVKGVLAAGIMDVVINTFMTWITVVAYYALTMIILFLCQGTVIGMIMYILLSAKTIPSIIKLLGSLLNLSKYHLQTYTLNSMLNVATARLLLGSVHIGSWIGILIYALVGFVLTNLIFKKLELNF